MRLFLAAINSQDARTLLTSNQFNRYRKRSGVPVTTDHCLVLGIEVDECFAAGSVGATVMTDDLVVLKEHSGQPVIPLL
jgi:hypothetical protein